MFPAMDMATLWNALAGAAGGAAIAGLAHGWSDRARILRLWRGVDPAEDESTYQPGAPSSQERRKLPLVITSAAIGGAAFWTGWVTGSDVLATLGLAAIGVLALFWTLLEDRAQETGAPPDRSCDGEARPSRWMEAGTHLAGILLLLGLLALESPALEDWRDEIGLTTGRSFAIFLGGGAIIGGWHLYRLWRTAPDANDIGIRADYETTKQDICRMAAAIGITAVFVGFIALIAF